MHLLVVNSGSSSIKFSIFVSGEGEPRSLYEGEVTGIGTERAAFEFGPTGKKSKAEPVRAENSIEAIGRVVETVSTEGMPKVDAVGYRVVHPGAEITSHVRIDDEVMREVLEHMDFEEAAMNGRNARNS